MIFAMMGSNPYFFKRLSDSLSRLAREAGEKVLVQSGNFPGPDRCESVDFKSREEVLSLIYRAEVFVAQGGYGACADGIICGKVPVVMPRRKELGECIDEQVEIVDYLEARGLVLKAETYEKLLSAVGTARDMQQHRSFDEQSMGHDVAREILRYLNRKS